MKAKRRKGLSTIAYEHLKQSIINGDYHKNTVLTEEGIAKELNISRTPVRTALIRLENENYVKSIPGVGNIIIELSIKDLADIYEVRSALESIALKTSINTISDKEISLMEKEFKETIEKCKADDSSVSFEYMTDLDNRFHDMIINNSYNDYVKESMARIDNRLMRYKYEAYATSYEKIETTNQHLDILQTIKTRDYDLAKEKLVNHIEWSYKILFQSFSNLQI